MVKTLSFCSRVFIDIAQDLIKRPALTDVDLGRRFSATVDFLSL